MSDEELIETLRLFEEKRVEQLPESARQLFYAIMKIADERDRLNNIINELEKYLEEETRLSDEISDYTLEHSDYTDVLDKLKELKENNK